MGRDRHRIHLVQPRAIEVQGFARAGNVGNHEVEDRMGLGAAGHHGRPHGRDRGDAVRHLLQPRHGRQALLGLCGGAHDLLQALHRIAHIGGQVGQQQRDLVSAGIGLAVQRHRHHRDQRFAGQRVVGLQVPAQRAGADRQRNVVDGGASGRADALEPGQRIGLGCKAARARNLDIEGCRWCLERQRGVVVALAGAQDVAQPAADAGQYLAPGARSVGELLQQARRRRARPGRRVAGQVLRPQRSLVFCRRARQAVGHHAGAGHAIDQRMVDLGVGGEAAVGQAFDDIGLPQRAVAVHQVAVQARDHRQQFADAPRMRQGQVAQVVVELELPVFLPVPQPHAQYRPLVERRQRHQVAAPVGDQAADVMWPRALGWRVDVEAGHMHRLAACFHPQEDGVGGAECFHAVFPLGWGRATAHFFRFTGPAIVLVARGAPPSRRADSIAAVARVRRRCARA